MKKDDVFYQAMLARDNRFDGKFFIGVKTTGIYCRPICPAKPKRENVEFFASYLAAEKAGFRPCLRCRPESAPGSPLWIGKSAMVKRAVRLINSQETLNFNEDHFAEIFGVTARHLRRVFMDEIGKTPKQLAFENRLNLARKLLTETNLSTTDIAFSSGFESIRRFNDAFKKRFKKSPSEIRRLKVKEPSLITLSLSYRPPYDFKGLFDSYKNHRIGNLEEFVDDSMIRHIIFDNKKGKVTISNDEKNSSLIVQIDFPDLSYLQTILAKVRSMFDLDSDPVLIANALEVDPKFKKILKKHQGLRLPSGWDGWEVAIGTILGQLVSIEMGRKLVSDLINNLSPDGSFPGPEILCCADLGFLRTTLKRKQTIKDFATAVKEGSISLEPTQDLEHFFSSLKKIKGIGPWTAQYMALKVLKHTDAFPATDLIIARALKLHSQEVINRMSPWRGYATILLWKEYAVSLKKV